MGPNSDQSFHRQGLKRPQCFKNAPHPPRHFTGRVDVVGLRVLSKSLLQGADTDSHAVQLRGIYDEKIRLIYTTYLGHGVELNHGSSKWFCVRAQRWNEPQHCTVEGTIDLGQRCGSGIVHIHHGNMAQESRWKKIKHEKHPILNKYQVRKRSGGGNAADLWDRGFLPGSVGGLQAPTN